jgi:RNA polymerase sigma factor (sigma-70 family)
MGDVISLRASVSRVQTQTLDRTAFEELYSTYLPKVYNYVCYRVGDESTAEDITAEIFERALTHLHTYRSDRGAFSTWLFRIARNLVANHLRARGRRPEVHSLESLPQLAVSQLIAGDVSPEQAAIEADQLGRVQVHMRKLPKRQQEVLALKFGGGLGNQELARAMRLKPNHVGVLLHRAVRALRLALEEEEEEEEEVKE